MKDLLSTITWQSDVDPGVWKPLRSWLRLAMHLDNLHVHRVLELRREGTDLRARVEIDSFDFTPDYTDPRGIAGRIEYPPESMVTLTLAAPYTEAGPEYDGLITAGAIEIWLNKGLSTTLGSLVRKVGE